MKHISEILKETLKRIDHEKRCASKANARFRMEMRATFDDKDMFNRGVQK